MRTARIRLREVVDSELLAMEKTTVEEASKLADAKVDVIAFGSIFSASFFARFPAKVRNRQYDVWRSENAEHFRVPGGTRIFDCFSLAFCF